MIKQANKTMENKEAKNSAKVANFEIELPTQFTQKSTVGKPRLTNEQVIETYVNNLRKLADFYAGKKVTLQELKYGRPTDVIMGMEQNIPSKGRAKLVGLDFAGHNTKETDVKVMVNGQETICLNLTGSWKIGDGKPFAYSIFAGKF